VIGFDDLWERKMRFMIALALISAPVPAIAEENKPVPATATAAAYSVEDTDIGTLIDDPAARAIIDKHIPGMTTNSQIEMARSFTLRQIQQFAADQVTDEVLAKIEADFKVLAAK
jgi:hypothetical protein